MASTKYNVTVVCTNDSYYFTDVLATDILSQTEVIIIERKCGWVSFNKDHVLNMRVECAEV